MAIKPFEIQSPSLVLAGVQMQAGATGVVIPGVTQATSYSVEEVEDTGDQTQTFGIIPTVIDNGYFTILNGGPTPAGYTESVYTVEELDGDSYITDIQVDTAGAFPASYQSTVAQNMWATEVPDAINNFNPSDWVQIPFQPVVRAGEIENLSGAGFNTYAQYNQYTCEYTDGDQIFMPGNQTVFLSTDYYIRFVDDPAFAFYQIQDFQYDGGSNYTSITLNGTPGTKNNVVFWTYLYVQNPSEIIPGDNITFTSFEGAVILDAAGGGNATPTPTSDGTFSTLPDFLDFVAYTSLKTGQTGEGVFFSGNAQIGPDGNISYPVRTDFSINGTTKVVVTVDMVMNDNCSDFGLCVFEEGIEPQWQWGPNTTRLSAQYDCTNPQLNSFTDQIQSSYDIPGPGTYRVRFTYDPNNSPNLMLETMDTNNNVLDTLTTDGTLNTSNSYCIGFAADQDSTELRTYIKNLSIAIDGGTTYADTLQQSNYQLTNGDNSFVLNSDGNVVFQGPGPGAGVDRGLVWDYGVGQSGVNSQVRQDEMGITVRAYTQNGGGANGYSAPVNIVTNQDSTQQTWTFDGQGNITFPDGSIQSTAYVTPVVTGFFDRMNQTLNPTNTINGEASLVDTGGNTYVSYSYYDNNDGRNYGGIIKYNLDGVKQWSRNIFSPNVDADYLKIVSLEQSTFSGGSFVQATGYYYDNVQSKNIGFSYLIDPDGGTGTPLDTEVSGDNTLILNDAVGGIDYNNNDFTVIAGTVSNEVLTKSLTPISPSGVNKLYITWTDFNNNNLVTGDRLVVSNFGGYGWGDINTIYTIASPDGTVGDGTFLNLRITYNDAGTYSIVSNTGWGGDPSSWTTPIALKVLGSNLGGADTTNDLTFDFDPTVFSNNGNNIHLAVSNIAGTSISDVFSTFYNDYDFGQAGVIDTLTDFQYNVNEQAFIGRLGQTTAWSKKFGTTNDESVNSVAVDNNGYIYTAGYAWNGTKGGLVVKYDINGNEQWAKYIDPDTDTGIDVYSIDLTSDGQVICISDNAIVTQLNSTDGAIMWQKQISTSISWDSNPRGTATPDGNYIFTNYEDNDYTLYVVCVSCVDGSELWSKNIAINYNSNGGQVYIQSDYRAQIIDCNSDHVSIAASMYYWDGSQDVYSGLVVNMPIDGSMPDDTYDNTYVVTTPGLNWTTLTTTSENASLTYQDVFETAGPASPTGNGSLITATNTIVGGGPVSLTNGTSNVAILNPSGNISMAVNGGNVAYITDGSISIGKNAGYFGNDGQGNNAIAIGWHAGDGDGSGQGANSIAIGADDVGYNQSANSIAIGYQAGWADGTPIGENSVVIGSQAGYGYASANSIILNASGTTLNSDNQGFYVNPVRENSGSTGQFVYYNTSTKELTYYANSLGNIVSSNLDGNSSNILYGNGVFAAAPGGGSYGNSNVATFLGSYGSNTIVTTGNVSVGQLKATATDSYDSIQFSDNGTNDNGSIRVDAGSNMVVKAASNFYVKRAGSDRLGITDTTTTLAASTNAVIQSNSTGTSKTWTFGSNGNITFPDTTVQTTAWTGTVAVANVTGIGNIATINLDGNTSNILYGNGSFAGITSLTHGNSNIVVNANANVIISTNGNASVMDVGADGRVRMINGAKIIGGNIVGGDGYIQFTSSTLTMFAGNVQLLGGGYIKGPAGVNVIQLNSPENTSARIIGNLAVGSSNTGNIYGGNITLSGNISGNTNGYALGYLNIPQVSASNTTLAASDAGKHYYSTTAGNFTLTIPNNATTSFATGTAISIVVQAAGNILVNAASGVTLYMAGNSTAANRVVGTYGMATLMKVASDTWFINGTGVS